MARALLPVTLLLQGVLGELDVRQEGLHGLQEKWGLFDDGESETQRTSVMRCNMNCYGDGAKPQLLPGATGSGDDLRVTEVTHETCRQYCKDTVGCEGVVFSKTSSPTVCYGKTDIHTSKCQHSDTYVTEIVNGAPWGKCALLGDPHVRVFDNANGNATVDQYEPGEYLIIQNDQLNVHGRMGYTRRFPNEASMVGIAVSGSLIHGQILVVTFEGCTIDQLNNGDTSCKKGPEGFKVTWDGQQVLEKMPSNFTSKDGTLTSKFDYLDPSAYHKDARHTIGGTSGLYPSYYFDLVPNFKIYVLLGEDNMNVVIEARKLPGKQDGYCGNFNCDPDDDTLDKLKERGVAAPIPVGQSLFASSNPPPYSEMAKPVGTTPAPEDCDKHVRVEAEKRCKGDKACIFDACKSGNVSAAKEYLGLEKAVEKIMPSNDGLNAPFDCNAGYANWEAGWSVEKKQWCCTNTGRGCPPTSSGCNETRPIKRDDSRYDLTCALNCYGDGAEDVQLDGTLGNGENGGITGLTLKTCQDYCFATNGCQGITFMNTSTPSMCFGKRNIHLSRCQPSSGYFTQVLTMMPFGTCALMGDPHIVTFDRHHHGHMIDVFQPGEFWLVKSEELVIQGRYGYTKRFPAESSLVGIAVSGSLIGGHTLIVEYQGPGLWQDGFFVSWNGQRILTTYPSTYASPDQRLKAKLEPLDPDNFHQDARHTIGGIPGSGRLASYLFEIVPDVQIYLLLGQDSMNAVITMRKLTSGQDGFCGNFNCNIEDDSIDALKAEGVTGRISEVESLFKGAPPPPMSEIEKGTPRGSKGIEDCDPTLKAAAEQECAAHQEVERKNWCIFDVCVSGSTSVALTDTLTSIVEQSIEAPQAFDCNAGFANWELGWSVEKKEWCCKHTGKGCSVAAGCTTPGPGGCATPAPTTSWPYDCDAGFANWKLSWTASKKAWCCTNAGRGCTDEPGCTSAAKTLAPITPATTTTTLWTMPTSGPAIQIQLTTATFTTTTFTTTTTTSTTTTTTLSTTTTSTTTTTVSTTTTPPSIKPILRCPLNCFGEGATPVSLPGATGQGENLMVVDVTLKACRDLCFNEDDCDSILYSNATSPSRCYGKKDVHTSKCIKSNGDYMTEVLRALPFGTCAFFGDPHIHPFDDPYGMTVDQYDPGEYWAIKSAELSVQVRYGMTKRFPDASSTTGIAIGGPLLRDHVLVAAFVGPEEGFAGFKVFWDGTEILAEFPSKYASSDSVLIATHDAMDPTKYHREGRHTIGDATDLASKDLPSYLFQLVPNVRIYMLLGPDNANIIIQTKKLASGQDGYCGNFNCNPDDDTLEEFQARGVVGRISLTETLFSSAPPAPTYQMLQPDKPLSVKDCPTELHALAVSLCRKKGVGNSQMEQDCIFDCCAGGEEACKSVVAADIATQEIETSVDSGSMISEFTQQLLNLGQQKVPLASIALFAFAAGFLVMGVMRLTHTRRNVTSQYDRLFNETEDLDSDSEQAREALMSPAGPARRGGLLSFSPVAMLHAASHMGLSPVDAGAASEDEPLMAGSANI